MTLALVMGIVYVTIGVYGVAQNILTAILLRREVNINNPTYYCMFQLCLTEAVILLPLSVFTGLALLCPVLQDVDMVYRVCAYIVAIGFYGGSGFMVMMTVSRCVQLVWPHLTDRLFSKRRLIFFTCASYICPVLCFIFVFTHETLLFTFYPHLFTWRYVHSELGRVALKVNLTWNILCVFMLVIFNGRSLYWVHVTRKQIQNIAATANRNREIKLFIQCAITAFSYITCTILFFGLAFVGTSENVSQSIATHLVWLSIHLQSPMVYLAVNKKLRLGLVRLICCKNESSTVDSRTENRTATCAITKDVTAQP